MCSLLLWDYLQRRKSRVWDAFFAEKMAYPIFERGRLILFCGISGKGDLVLLIGGVKFKNAPH